jgi:hypothetical protein
MMTIVKRVFRGRSTTFILTENWYRRPRTIVSENWTATYYWDGGANIVGNECIEELIRLICLQLEDELIKRLAPP